MALDAKIPEGDLEKKWTKLQRPCKPGESRQ